MAITTANAIGCRKGRKIQKASAREPTSKARRNKTLAIEFSFFTRRPEVDVPAERQCILSRLRGAIGRIVRRVIQELLCGIALVL